MTDPGGFAPIVVHPEIRIVGESQPLPKPIRVTLPVMLTGILDGQWVEVEGLVHSAEVEGMHVILTLATVDGMITASAVKENGANYASLGDSRILIRGQAAPLVGNKRQLLGVRILFPGLRAITVEEPAPLDPFALPLHPLSSLLQYLAVEPLQHQVHVRGEVTLNWPGRKLCILDGDDGLCVHTVDRTALQEGDLVDVIGFPAREDFEPTLSDATLRPAGSGSLPAPERITVEEAFQGDRTGDVVQIEGRLIGKSLVMGDSMLLLSSGRFLFPAILPAASFNPGKDHGPEWVDGSTVRVTGVFFGKVDARQIARKEGISSLESFQILLRSPQDVAVLEAPSWWTGQHALLILGLVATLTVAVLFWVAVLRRQVAQQTLHLRRSEERFRHLARHDALTGLTVRTVLMERLELSLQEARNKQMPFALLMIDVDRFKQINDTQGHAVGDEILCIVGKRILASVRETDTVARMGGDEFTVLLQGVPGMEEGGKIAAQMVANVSAQII